MRTEKIAVLRAKERRGGAPSAAVRSATGASGVGRGGRLGGRPGAVTWASRPTYPSLPPTTKSTASSSPALATRREVAGSTRTTVPGPASSRSPSPNSKATRPAWTKYSSCCSLVGVEVRLVARREHDRVDAEGRDAQRRAHLAEAGSLPQVVQRGQRPPVPVANRVFVHAGHGTGGGRCPTRRPSAAGPPGGGGRPLGPRRPRRRRRVVAQPALELLDVEVGLGVLRVELAQGLQQQPAHGPVAVPLAVGRDDVPRARARCCSARARGRRRAGSRASARARRRRRG